MLATIESYSSQCSKCTVANGSYEVIDSIVSILHTTVVTVETLKILQNPSMLNKAIVVVNRTTFPKRWTAVSAPSLFSFPTTASRSASSSDFELCRIWLQSIFLSFPVLSVLNSVFL